MKATVVGAGITGITTAYFLARAGYSVTIIDREPYPAMVTSYANGGQISASNSEVWNSWSNVAKGIKWLFKPYAPFKINFETTGLKELSWFKDFILNIRNYNSNTAATCKMAIGSHKLYKQIAKEENLQFDKVEKGILHFYFNKKDLKHAQKVNRIYVDSGLNRYLVTPAEIASLEPHIDTSGMVGGFYTEDDYTGDIHKFCSSLFLRLINNHNVRFIQREIIGDDILEIAQKEKVVICAGVESHNISRTFGDNHKIYPVKGYSITIHEPEKAPWISLLDDKNKIVCSRLGENRLRIAGTAEFAGYDKSISQKRINSLLEWASNRFPENSMDNVTSWAGLRPMTPSMMPVVEKSENNSNVWYNTGHGHLGWTLAAYTAISVTEKILESEE
jgi:D-amino-acid dehydrogenase